MHRLYFTLILAVAVVSCALIPADQPTSASPEPAGTLVAETRVVDGDTIQVELDGRMIEVRLLGINTPEREECYGSEAREYARSLVADAAVRVEGSELDQFGRLLGYVYADGRLVNAALIESGHALALSTKHELLESFKGLEGAAQAGSVGLWSRAACPPASDAALGISSLVADAPGPDDQNPNGECVVITNNGPTGVDLTGWTVRDESSRHRFVFDGLVLEPGASVTLLSGSVGDPMQGRCDGLSDLVRFWEASDPVWSNRGDTAYLLDPSGNYHDRLLHAP